VNSEAKIYPQLNLNATQESDFGILLKEDLISMKKPKWTLKSMKKLLKKFKKEVKLNKFYKNS